MSVSRGLMATPAAVASFPSTPEMKLRTEIWLSRVTPNVFSIDVEAFRGTDTSPVSAYTRWSSREPTAE